MKQFTDFLCRIVGLSAFAVTFVPTYYAEDMVWNCLDPAQWEIVHTHPEMLYALGWIIGAFPFLLLGIKHGLFFSLKNGAISWGKASSGAIFWLVPATTAYASILGAGCPFAVTLQNYLLITVLVLTLGSFALYLHAVCKENAAPDEQLNEL
ncbi:MAG: hypothetical protein VZR95_07095 [Alphaproteobacteria bacterium]